MDLNKNTDYLYHYTSVETLGLILSSRTLKFTPLDHLDDLEEGKSIDATPLRRFRYISCWTDDEKESIPMWKMYATLDNGVRVKMIKYPFNKVDLKRYSGIIQGTDAIEDDSPHRFSLIPLEKTLSLPYTFNYLQCSDFLFKVKYTDEVQNLYPKIVEKDGKGIKVANGILGLFKGSYWSFQREWRYIINLLPENQIKLTESREKVLEMINNMFDEKYENPIPFFTLDLSQEAIDCIEVTLSPNLDISSKKLVYEYRNNFAPKMIITESVLTGKIRKE